MGHMIERIALGRGHEVVCISDPLAGSRGELRDAEVAIEFTTPATAEQNVRKAWAAGLPVVCGTTGWDAAALMKEAEETGHTLVWSSNFSIGVNVLFQMNKALAAALAPYGYTPRIEEIHHIHKLDKPSGTAKTLAEGIGHNVAIESIREGEVPGTHTITWDSPEDTIVLSHIAKGRQGFALGAVIAAEKITEIKN